MRLADHIAVFIALVMMAVAPVGCSGGRGRATAATNLRGDETASSDGVVTRYRVVQSRDGPVRSVCIVRYRRGSAAEPEFRVGTATSGEMVIIQGGTRHDVKPGLVVVNDDYGKALWVKGCDTSIFVDGREPSWQEVVGLWKGARETGEDARSRVGP
jgi:hypothetical protein